MALVDEGFTETKDVMLVVGITFLVQLRRYGRQESISCLRSQGGAVAYHPQYLHFHHTLVEVGRLVLDNLDSNNLVRFHILTFDNLAESSLAENVENEVFAAVFRRAISVGLGITRARTSLMTLILAQPIINVENVVVIFVIESVVMDRFTRFRQNSSRVVGCFITEGGIANAVGRCYVSR